jgi:ABC-type sugar transport system ATPase subunit
MVDKPGVAMARRHGIGTVFQELTLMPFMTVAENLMLGQEPCNRLGLIDRRNLPRIAERRLAELCITHVDPRALASDISLAERQLVEIARVILAAPDIMLLDEPTSALVERGVEVATKHEIYDLISRLAGEGYAILFYSSDAEELAHLCHRVRIMQRGRFVAELAADELTAEAIVAAAMRDAAPAVSHAA